MVFVLFCLQFYGRFENISLKRSHLNKSDVIELEHEKQVFNIHQSNDLVCIKFLEATCMSIVTVIIFLSLYFSILTLKIFHKYLINICTY